MTCSRCGTPMVNGAVQIRGRIVLLLLAATMVASWVLVGGLIHDPIEGLDRSRLQTSRLLVPVVLLVATVVAAMRWRRRPHCPSCDDAVWRPLTPRQAAHPARRSVLRGVSMLAAGAVGGVG